MTTLGLGSISPLSTKLRIVEKLWLPAELLLKKSEPTSLSFQTTATYTIIDKKQHTTQQNFTTQQFHLFMTTWRKVRYYILPDNTSTICCQT